MNNCFSFILMIFDQILNTMKGHLFEYKLSITKEDIDQNDHVNNVVYLKWVQDAAIAHWNAVSTDQMKEENVWVISRHEIDYLNSCFLNDEIIAKTWVGQTEGVRSVRHVGIHNKTTGKIAAKIATTWILLEPKTIRPKRISEELRRVFF